MNVHTLMIVAIHVNIYTHMVCGHRQNVHHLVIVEIHVNIYTHMVRGHSMTVHPLMVVAIHEKEIYNVNTGCVASAGVYYSFYHFNILLSF